MNAVLDRCADWSESPAARGESNEPRRIGNETSRSKRARITAPIEKPHNLSRSASWLLEGADSVLSAVFVGALLIVSVGFSMLMIAATLVALLCGLACYS